VSKKIAHKGEQVVVPFVLALSAASFIYIVLADLISGKSEKRKWPLIN
jgi:hypothetical protein